MSVTTSSLIVLIVNTALLAVAFVLTIVLLRAGARHEYHYGRSEIQEQLRRIIMWVVLILIAMSFLATIFNLLFPMFFGDATAY